jgi:hypothetical protein
VKRPSHATVVAYLALFIALCTGVGFAASKITSSKQIKRNVVNSGDVKDASLQGRDVKDEALSGADVGDGSLAGADLLDGSVGTADLRNGSVGGIDIADGAITGSDVAGGSIHGRALSDDSVTGDQVDESSLALTRVRGFSSFQAGSVPIDNGGSFSSPRSPEGSLAALALPPGRYFLTAHAIASADDNGGSVYCLFGGGGDYVETGADISSIDFGGAPSTAAGISVSAIRESDSSFVVRLLCSDDNTVASANDRGIEAISLQP